MASVIRETLGIMGAEVTRVSSKKLKSLIATKVGEEIANTTFNKARNMAIEGTPWSLQGRSLVMEPQLSG